MANLSDCSLYFSGTREDIKKIIAETINGYMDENALDKKRVMDIILNEEEDADFPDLSLSFATSDGSKDFLVEVFSVYSQPIKNMVTVFISGTGRWNGPLNWASEIASKYNVYVNYVDSEPGNNFFVHRELARGGDVIKNTDSFYCSKESIAYFGTEYWYENRDGFYTTLEEAEEFIQLMVEAGETREEVLNKLGILFP